MILYPIYFSDLNEEAQDVLLEAVGAKSPKEMNWDIYPITECDIEEVSDQKGETK